MSNTQVLLVEDEPIIQKIHTLQLQENRCDVDIASSGKDALLKAGQRYDLILMDIGLPDISGIEVIKKIRAHAGENQTTPIVVLTAYASRDVCDECLEAGAQTIYIKPVLPDKFIAMVANLF